VLNNLDIKVIGFVDFLIKTKIYELKYTQRFRNPDSRQKIHSNKIIKETEFRIEIDSVL
jgi:hypothetical protein